MDWLQVAFGDRGALTAIVICVRPLERGDAPLLPHFLALAAHEEDVEVVLANPALALYVAGWGRDGDHAVVAQESELGAVVGMAWARFWTAEHKGFGWVDEVTPELGVAVEPAFQGRGIGGQLIEALKERLALVSVVDSGGRKFSPSRVALNVRADSAAVKLYERLGFTKVEGSERRNRTGGVSFNMVARL